MNFDAKVLFALALSALLTSSSFAEDRVLMASLGDSLTAASLATTSLSEGTNKDRAKNKETLSWASGTQIASHFVRLGEWMRSHGDTRTLEVLNVATGGNTTSQLEAQAKLVAAKMAEGAHQSLAYVTILIGGNDVCDGWQPSSASRERVTGNLKRALAVLNAIPNPEPIRVFLSSVPRIPDIGVVEIMRHPTRARITCETLHRRALNVCDPMILWSTEAGYQSRVKIVDAMNTILRSIATSSSTEFPNLDLAYGASVYQQPVSPALLAADCFHPSRLGQEQLSQAAWSDQPWFRSSP